MEADEFDNLARPIDDSDRKRKKTQSYNKDIPER